MKRYLYKENKKGFTLVELMVAMVISIIAAMGAYDVYISQNHAYSVQAQISDMQQNARVAMDLITREIRTAGCDPAEVGIQDIVTATQNTIQIRADLNGDGNTAGLNEDITFAFVNNTITRTDAVDGIAQPIAVNILDLQFVYGLDVNGDGAIFTQGTAANDDEWVFNFNGDTIAGTIAAFGGNGTINDSLNLVRITIRVISARPDPNMTNLCNAAGTCCGNGCGGFRLRVLNSFARPRNLGL